MATLQPAQDLVPPAFCSTHACTDTLTVHYLGASGFVIGHGDDVVVTGPLLSNPNLLRIILPLEIQSDTMLIHEVLDTMPALKRARGILIGHSHYDHLMDVPFIARRYIPGATIIGSETMRRLLAPFHLDNPIITVDSANAATDTSMTAWIALGPRIRVLPLVSEHAPNLLGRTFAPGEAPERETPPKTAADWKGGDTFAYLIDFLGDDGAVIFRVHYQDAASTPPLGFPPATIRADGKRVDLAIICAGNFNNVKGYPDGVVQALQPRTVIVGHWEDFFRPRRASPTSIVFEKTGELARRVSASLPADASWAAPVPGALLQLYAP